MSYKIISKFIKDISFEIPSAETFIMIEKEISKARTFCFLHEIEELFNKNLIKGGDLNNAIVIVDKVVDNKFSDIWLDLRILLFSKYLDKCSLESKLSKSKFFNIYLGKAKDKNNN